MQVLVIDDDTALLRSLEILLSKQGHRVKTCSDVRAAFSFIERDWSPDVLVLDYLIPPYLGGEVLNQLRPHLPDRCRVILISGHTDMIESLDLTTMGIDAFLPKPVDINQLSGLVSEKVNN